MANQVKGEIGFKALDRDFNLHLDFERLCANEDDLPGIMAQGMDISKPSLLRTVIRVGLLNHHPEADDALAMKIINDLGIVAASLIAKASVDAAFVPNSPEAAEGAANPPPPAQPKRRPPRGAGKLRSVSG